MKNRIGQRVIDCSGESGVDSILGTCIAVTEQGGFVIQRDDMEDEIFLESREYMKKRKHVWVEDVSKKDITLIWVCLALARIVIGLSVYILLGKT